jgi:ubiquinone/menaquinone biosynthesis C-methylase UbiE
MVLNDPVRAYYEQNPLMVSSPFGGIDGVNRELYTKVWREIGVDVSGLKVLDVGCGRGHVGALVEEAGGEYVGTDFVASGCRRAFMLADSARLPFGDASFDAVFCIDAFEHFPDSARVAAEFRRVLRPEGFVFLSTPNYGNVAGIVKWFCERFGSYRKDTWAPFRKWSPQELEQPLTIRGVRRLFSSCGFSRMRCMGHAAEVGLGLFPWIAHPRTPEFLMYRLQRFFGGIGPVAIKAWPGASLHAFWKIDADGRTTKSGD